VAEQLGEVLKRDVKAFAVPRAGWAEAFEQFGVPNGHTGPAEEMFESVNAGWMDLGITGTEHVEGTTSARDVFAAAQQAVKAKVAIPSSKLIIKEAPVVGFLTNSMKLPAFPARMSVGSTS